MSRILRYCKILWQNIEQNILLSILILEHWLPNIRNGFTTNHLMLHQAQLSHFHPQVHDVQFYTCLIWFVKLFQEVTYKCNCQLSVVSFNPTKSAIFTTFILYTNTVTIGHNLSLYFKLCCGKKITSM